MNFHGHELKKTDKGYEYYGHLDLSGCTSLTAIPDNLTVGGYLDLSGCTSLTAIPDNLAVGESLYLIDCTSLTAIPDNLTVGGSLYLIDCTSLTAIPDNLTVGGSLDLSGCTSLTAISDNLTVGGSLYLSGCTSLKNYPVVHNCGKVNRSIYIKKQNTKLIHIGCFVGTKKEAINSVSNKYKHDSNGYISKIKECFEIAERLWG